MSNYKRPIPQDSPSRQKVVEKKDAQGRTISREMKERKVITANKAPGVEIFEDEDHMVHVMLMKKENDPVKKEYIERSFIQSFHLTEFNLMKKNNLLHGWDAIEVVHDPTLQKGSKESQLAAGTATIPNEDEKLKAAAAKELADAQAKYLQLYGTPAPGDASLADLKELIDTKTNQLAQEKRGQIINAVNQMSEADIKKAYAKAVKAEGGQANENADLDSMKSVVVNYFMKESK